MPKKNTNQEMEDELEQMTSPPRSEASSGGPTITRKRYQFSEGCEMVAELAAKLEMVQKLPIKREQRILDLVAKFNDFP